LEKKKKIDRKLGKKKIEDCLEGEEVDGGGCEGDPEEGGGDGDGAAGRSCGGSTGADGLVGRAGLDELGIGVAGNHPPYLARGVVGEELGDGAGEVRAVRGEAVVGDAGDGVVAPEVAAAAELVEALEGGGLEGRHVGGGTLDGSAGGGLPLGLVVGT